MALMPTAVVIPVGAGRIQNVLAVLETLNQQTVKPRIVVLICDGPDAHIKVEGMSKLPTAVLNTPKKHEPGMEQPRNLGVRFLQDLARKDQRFADIRHVWFIDSDVIVRPRALEFYTEAYQKAEAWRCPCGKPHSIGESKARDRTELCCDCGREWDEQWKPAHSVFVGPYDWLPPGVREPDYDLRNDPDGVPPPGRWGRFDENEPDTPVVNDMFAGLACFSGNLLWNIAEFQRIGGFWNELHHGRCEDGEHGVRAVTMGVPITFVREARGWHLWHERNMEWVLAANQRDVPMLDARHPYLKDEGLFAVDEDGTRFNYRCDVCGEEMNAALSWGHRLMHPANPPLKP